MNSLLNSRQGHPISLLLFNIVLKFLARAIAQKRKRILTGKEEIKLSICRDMILLTKDPKDSTKKLLDLINIFGKVAGYKNQHSKLSICSIHQ
jgi:hypothetical protein